MCCVRCGESGFKWLFFFSFNNVNCDDFYVIRNDETQQTQQYSKVTAESSASHNANTAKKKTKKIDLSNVCGV